MNNEKITIIIPVHNSESTLKKCVDSVLKQTHSNLEIFLVNNGSTDNSLLMCRELAASDNRIRLIDLDVGNVSKARNAALEEMTGDYFAFIDSDDYVDLSMYEKLLNKAKTAQTDMVFCYFNLVVNNTVTPYIEAKLKDLVYNRQFNYIFESDENYVKANIWRTLFKSEKFNTVRFDENVYFGEDFVYMFNIFQISCNMSLLEECLYNYTLASLKMSKKYFNARMLQNDKLFSKYAYDFLNAFDMNDYAEAARYRSWVHVVHSVLAYSDNYREELSLIRSDEYWKEVTRKEYYKKFLKLLCPSFKFKARAFLLQHGLFGCYRVLIKCMI